MNKLTKSIFLSTIILFNTGCSKTDNSVDEIKTANNSNIKVHTEERSNNIKCANIEINTIDSSKVVKLEYNIDSTLEEKVNLILKLISENCFSGLPMQGKITDYKVVEIDLKEDESSKVSWEKTYLNDHTKDETINLIVKNILQEDFKFETNYIKEVRLYYDDNLITLD